MAHQPLERLPPAVAGQRVVQPGTHAGAAEQILLADRLMRNGVDVTDFEFKGTLDDGSTYDLDVVARDRDGTTYGYQLKEVSNPKKLFQKIQDNLRQLVNSPADRQIFVIDTKGTLADLAARNMPQRLLDHYGDHGVMLAIRVDDGVLYVPPDGTFYPRGLPGGRGIGKKRPRTGCLAASPSFSGPIAFSPNRACSSHRRRCRFRCSERALSVLACSRSNCRCLRAYPTPRHGLPRWFGAPLRKDP